MEMQESTLFVGEFHRTIDEKGRLTIPASWRHKKDQDGSDISYLALPTPDGNITVYSPKMVAQLEARISQVSIGDIEGQKAITELMSMAHSFICDKQGRINLNERLVGHAKIQKDVVLVGKLSTFSLFSDEGYEKFQSSYAVDEVTKAAVFQRFGL
jgi:MraZ protein